MAYDDQITLVGLVLETAAGLRRRLAPGVERSLGVTGQAFEVLLRLSRTPGGRLRMADLAAQTALTPSGLTRAVDRLETAGLVRREVCASDRRGAFATLTPLGAAKTELALGRHKEEIEGLLGALFDESEEAELAQLLRRLRDEVAPDAALNTLEVEMNHVPVDR
jgi:DNA-binding MarR family transcriptional regulator